MSDREPRTAPASELLPTLLGDYWFHSRAYIPSAALVRLLGEFGVGADAARAALSRQARKGRLEVVRRGRHTAYRLARQLLDAAAEQGRRLMRFGAEPVAWDGRWTCVAFSVPESDGHLRPVLRKRLRALGLGTLFDGLWITPHAPLEALDRCLTDLGIADAVVLRATHVPRPTGVSLVDAWDLPALRRRYDELIALVGGIQERLDGRAIPAAEALVARTELMRRWRALALTDPQLPDELLPADWPRNTARARFVEAYDALGPLAELRVRELVAAAGGGADGLDGADGPRHHRVDEIAGAPGAGAPDGGAPGRADADPGRASGGGDPPAPERAARHGPSITG
ncbi:MAG TPA: PaaX family transcriptional regulator C-terminal domain-containing protein [Acidimicrobiales bacterium]